MDTNLGTVVPHVACLMTLDFSRRYSDILAPITAPVGVNFISRYFPKRLELSLMAVHALPNASTRGFTWRIFSRSVRLLALKYKQQMMFKECGPDFWSANLTVIVMITSLEAKWSGISLENTSICYWSISYSTHSIVCMKCVS